MTIQLTSPAFEQGAYIPRKYTGEGADVSPALEWTDPPEGTQSLALICDDPDAPVGTWVHWVVWGIPSQARGLPAEAAVGNGGLLQDALADGIQQGMTDFRRIGYGGPMPPPGSDHRYFFKLYALDTALHLARGAAKKDLENAMRGHVLAEAQLMGLYRR